MGISRTTCTVLLADVTDREGFASADGTADDGELAEVLAELRAVWPRHALVVSRPATWTGDDTLPPAWRHIVDGVSSSGYYTDVKRLSLARAQRHSHMAVVRPSALLLPTRVLRTLVAVVRTRALDLATVSGIPSAVLYVVSARLLTLMEGAGAVPESVTIPQAVERLTAAGARLDRDLRVARLAPRDVSWHDQAIAAALPSPVWTTQRLGSLLASPPDSRLVEALRREQRVHADAREAIRCRAWRDNPVAADTRTPVLVTVPSRFQSGAQAAWAELVDYLPPAHVAFVVGRGTVLRDVLQSRGFTTYETTDGMAATSAPDAAVFLAALDHTRPELVHFDGVEGNAWAATVHERGMRVVQHVRLNDVERFRPSFVYAGAIVGVSSHVCREIDVRVGATSRVVHIPDGVCLRSRPQRLPEACRAASGGDGLSCLCAGRVEPAKDQLRVLDIVEALRHVVPCRLQIVGSCGRDAAYCDQLRDRMRAAGDGIDWHPFVHPMSDLYRQADVVIVGSRNEALGMVGLEALAAGALLVAHRSTGYASIVDPSHLEGLLFDSEEPAADVAVRIVEALARRESYVVNGRRKVSACFDARDTANRLMELWRDVGR